MTVSGIDTPALVIDLDIMERNLRRMSEYARLHNRKLRPPTKTHKMPRLGRKQLDLGAAGITVAKVGEPEVMLAVLSGDDSGIDALAESSPPTGANSVACAFLPV